MFCEPHSGQKLNLLSFIGENISLCGGKVKGVTFVCGRQVQILIQAVNINVNKKALPFPAHNGSKCVALCA